MENQRAADRSGQAENGGIEWSRTFRGTRMSKTPSPMPARAWGRDVTPDIINAGITPSSLEKTRELRVTGFRLGEAKLPGTNPVWQRLPAEFPAFRCRG